MLFDQPALGFHFAVIFELFPQLPNDFKFKEVSGLKATVETEAYKEGGQNLFTWQLPTRKTFSDITLKRGVFIGSFVTEWARKAIEEHDYQPTNVIIALLNNLHIPITAWYVVNAYPVAWEVSSFNAENSEVVIESITLKYNHFKLINATSLLPF